MYCTRVYYNSEIFRSHIIIITVYIYTKKLPSSDDVDILTLMLFRYIYIYSCRPPATLAVRVFHANV